MTTESHSVSWKRICDERCEWRQYIAVRLFRGQLDESSRRRSVDAVNCSFGSQKSSGELLQEGWCAVSSIVFAVTSTRILELSEARMSL